MSNKLLIGNPNRCLLSYCCLYINSCLFKKKKKKTRWKERGGIKLIEGNICIITSIISILKYCCCLSLLLTKNHQVFFCLFSYSIFSSSFIVIIITSQLLLLLLLLLFIIIIIITIVIVIIYFSSFFFVMSNGDLFIRCIKQHKTGFDSTFYDRKDKSKNIVEFKDLYIKRRKKKKRCCWVSEVRWQGCGQWFFFSFNIVAVTYVLFLFIYLDWLKKINFFFFWLGFIISV